jgi:hypothetical protein
MGGTPNIAAAFAPLTRRCDHDDIGTPAPRWRGRCAVPDPAPPARQPAVVSMNRWRFTCEINSTTPKHGLRISQPFRRRLQHMGCRHRLPGPLALGGASSSRFGKSEWRCEQPGLLGTLGSPCRKLPAQPQAALCSRPSGRALAPSTLFLRSRVSRQRICD